VLSGVLSGDELAKSQCVKQAAHLIKFNLLSAEYSQPNAPYRRHAVAIAEDKIAFR